MADTRNDESCDDFYSDYGEWRAEAEGLYSTRRKKLNDAEKNALRHFADLYRKSIGVEAERQLVVDATICWPLCYRYQFHFQMKERPFWPVDYTPTRGMPQELAREAAMLSMLPLSLFGKVRRHGTTPLQRRIGLVSRLVEFCDELTAYYSKCGRAGPVVRPPRFYIESTDTLVTSQRFASEEEATAWVHGLGCVFSHRDFIAWLKDYDTQRGCDRWVNHDPESEEGFGDGPEEQLFFSVCGEYSRPLHISFGQWLPALALSMDKLASIASSSGLMAGDAGGLQLAWGLESRGYAKPEGERKSYELRCDIPERIFITGTGLERAIRLEKEAQG